jgi:hypothetical protein
MRMFNNLRKIKMEKTFYISKEQFVAVTSKWKSGNTHTVADHIIYNVLRSKPIDLGFSKKTKHIQAMNPWYAFNNASSTAKWMCDMRVQADSKKEIFKQKFGIDMPEGIASKFEGVKK